VALKPATQHCPLRVKSGLLLLDAKRSASSGRFYGAFMLENFHESYPQGEIKAPGERSTGIVFAAVAAIVAFKFRDTKIVPWVALSLAAVLLVVSLFAPHLLKTITAIWFRLGLLLHRLINPVVMFAIFSLVIVPAGYVMRIWHDPLRRRRLDAPGSSYWIEQKGIQKTSMARQF
jgi:hypothetical protein